MFLFSILIKGHITILLQMDKARFRGRMSQEKKHRKRCHGRPLKAPREAALQHFMWIFKKKNLCVSFTCLWQELHSGDPALVTMCKFTTPAAVSTPTVNMRATAASPVCRELEVIFQLLSCSSAALHCLFERGQQTSCAPTATDARLLQTNLQFIMRAVL